MPSTAAASVMTVGLDHDQDSVYHVYSSISDAPNCSNQKETPYSLIQEYRPTHIQSTQQENYIDVVTLNDIVLCRLNDFSSVYTMLTVTVV
ncbi:hypothetical protein AALO_G00188970 [Alosa alosa]|uniref:Uncharacterized protein n=1 Tax=Alosa alosa TaxID=278164 RepID=A0AAV6G4S4_9TELE|nr:hypothetical protein AALO_G00188970 [Alosa alosa]